MDRKAELLKETGPEQDLSACFTSQWSQWLKAGPWDSPSRSPRSSASRTVPGTWIIFGFPRHIFRELNQKWKGVAGCRLTHCHNTSLLCVCKTYCCCLWRISLSLRVWNEQWFWKVLSWMSGYIQGGLVSSAIFQSVVLQTLSMMILYDAQLNIFIGYN